MYLRATLFVVVVSQALPILGAIHERLHTIPNGWTECSSAPDNSSTITLTVALAHQNLDQLDSRLMAISTPGNPSYGQHLSKNDIDALFAPSEAAKKAVKNWLQSAGVSSISSDEYFVTFVTTVDKASNLLHATFKNYENGGSTKMRTKQYSVPNDLKKYIDLIFPTTYFGKTAANIPTSDIVERDDTPTHRSTRSIDPTCEAIITPSCLKEMYNIGNYTPTANSGSKIGFTSFVKQSAFKSDLQQYETYFNIPSQEFEIVTINGGINNQDPNNSYFRTGEAALDVQTIVGVSHPIPVTEFITGGTPPFVPTLDQPTPEYNENEPYLPFFNYLLSQPTLPQVITNSYGDDEESVPRYYATYVCNSIAMLGLRGVSVLTSSGDAGVGSSCRSNDGKNTTQFMPQFPASCPYITTVGGTQATMPEVAWVFKQDNYTGGSSGGFSNYFARPAYQNTAVRNYLSSHISAPTKKYYEPFANFAGRGYPDISAHSDSPSYLIFIRGKMSKSGGTSAAAPAVAGIIALLNDARLRAGKPVLGWINPLLYAIGQGALNDITSGGSVGCTGFSLYGDGKAHLAGAGVIPYASWNATEGWDPVTGLGTPNFQALKNLVLGI